MHIRLATDSDEKNWNIFTSQHPQASPYHNFSWKKSIEKSYGHACYYLIAENTNQEIVGVLPTVSIKLPLIHGNLCALPFCDLGASLTIDSNIEKQLINYARNLASQLNLSSFEYRASEKLALNKEQLKRLSTDHKVRMLLELPESSDCLLASFKSKLRSQIRKAEKNGLTVELGHSSRLIEEFYDVFSCNMRDLGSQTHSKSWFSEINKNYDKNMIISIIKHKGQAIGAGIVLFNGTKATIPWASTKREFNRLSPNMLLYWSLLKYTTDHGYKSFDFGRSSYGEGTFKFKQQWGAKPIPLTWKTYYPKQKENTSTIETGTHIKSKIRYFTENMWRKLPLSLTILLGPAIRKYISL